MSETRVVVDRGTSAKVLWPLVRGEAHLRVTAHGGTRKPQSKGNEPLPQRGWDSYPFQSAMLLKVQENR